MAWSMGVLVSNCSLMKRKALFRQVSFSIRPERSLTLQSSTVSCEEGYATEIIKEIRAIYCNSRANRIQ